MSSATVELLWIPLGAGGWFVANNGRVYERILAWRDRRHPEALYHTALKVAVPEGRYVIENAWPIPDARGAERGVVVEGPVFHEGLGRLRALRYEVRRWRNGTIDDERWVARVDAVTTDVRVARRLLDLVPDVPPRVWGRDDAGVGDMWNSNSVIAWLLQRAGAPMARARPPDGGRAPGWRAGVTVARLTQEERALGSPAPSPPRSRPTSSPGRGG